MRTVVAVLLLMPMTAPADDEPTFPVFALGTGMHTSCGQFVAATEGHKLNTHSKIERNGTTFASENEVLMQYAFGLLTGLNMARDRSHQIQTDNAAIELWLRNWCTQHPTRDLVAAVTKFASETPGTPLQ